MEARSRQFDPRTIGARTRGGHGAWHRILPWLYGTVILLVCALLAALLWPQFQTLMAYHQRKADRLAELAAQEALGRALDEERLRLESDPVYIERMARDILNFGRPGETIFRFQPYSALPPPPSGSAR
ncbi:MAG: septum formation initiator family protein [Verrucomicrobiia bacterium]